MNETNSAPQMFSVFKPLCCRDPTEEIQNSLKYCIILFVLPPLLASERSWVRSLPCVFIFSWALIYWHNKKLELLGIDRKRKISIPGLPFVE